VGRIFLSGCPRQSASGQGLAASWSANMPTCQHANIKTSFKGIYRTTIIKIDIYRIKYFDHWISLSGRFTIEYRTGHKILPETANAILINGPLVSRRQWTLIGSDDFNYRHVCKASVLVFNQHPCYLCRFLQNGP
jgi:hypothetical protein